MPGNIGYISSWNGSFIDKLHNTTSNNGACSGTVYALAFNPQGDLYIGGSKHKLKQFENTNTNSKLTITKQFKVFMDVVHFQEVVL